MKIKIVFDKKTIDKNLYTGWGISFLIDNSILFDTGENGNWLLHNINKLNIDVNQLEAIVISHNHWDHVNGLWEILKRKKNFKVYSCPNFGIEFEKKVKSLGGIIIENKDVSEIEQNIYVTGEITGEYAGHFMPEQSLVVKTKSGITVITGCSHPGIIKILEKVKEKFPQEDLYFVFGGFHLMDQSKRKIEIIVKKFIEMEVKKVGPTHCSGKETEEIFKEKYGNKFVSIKVGETLNI